MAPRMDCHACRRAMTTALLETGSLEVTESLDQQHPDRA